MATYKIKKKKDETLIICRGIPEGHINLDEVCRIEDKDIEGLYFPSEIKKKSVTYRMPVVISLEEFLKKEITIYQFYAIVVQLLEMSKKIECSGIQRENISYHPSLIFIKEMTEEMCFLYIKQITPGSNGNPFLLMRQMRSLIASTDRKTMKEFNAFASYIDQFNHLTIPIIESYIMEHYPQIYQQIERIDISKMQNHNRENERKNNSIKQSNVYRGDECINNVWKLIALDTHQTAVVNKNPYRIGKSSDNDLILNSGAVSRHHAILHTKSNELFVEDLGSTNHTYINGQIINSHETRKINEGDRLQVANVLFEVKNR